MLKRSSPLLLALCLSLTLALCLGAALDNATLSAGGASSRKLQAGIASTAGCVRRPRPLRKPKRTLNCQHLCNPLLLAWPPSPTHHPHTLCPPHLCLPSPPPRTAVCT